MAAEASATAHWSGTGKLRGGRWGIWFFITALRVLGLRLTYVLAAIAGAPLVHVFNLREPDGHYRFFAFPPQRPKLPPHNQRDAYLRDCAERFARDLETMLKRDPLQWYNFFPFWDQTDA